MQTDILNEVSEDERKALLMSVALIGLWILMISLALYTIVLGRGFLSLQQALRDLKAEFHGRFEKVVGNPVPAFSALTIDGQQRLTEEFLHHHPALLVFLSPACPHCHRVMSQLAELVHRWREQGGVIVGVSNGDPSEMLKLARKMEADFPILAQEAWELTQLFKVSSTPWGFAIAPSGLVTAAGPLGTSEQLDALMKAAEVNEPLP
jgi:peroxiredoxin